MGRRKVAHEVMVSDEPTGVPAVLTCHGNGVETVNQMKTLGIASERGDYHGVTGGHEMMILFPPVREDQLLERPENGT